MVALFVALLILVAALAYSSFSPKQATSTSAPVALTSTTLASTSHSSSTETSSTSSGSSATTFNSSNNTITTFQSMPAILYPPAGTFDPNNGYVYVSNAGNGTVSVISSSKNAVLAVLHVGSLWSSPSPPVLDPANGELFVSLEAQNTVVIISNETVVTTLPVGVAGSDPLTPLFDPQNGDFYVPTDASGFLSVISGATNSIVANVTVGTGIGGAALDSANGEIYLTSSNQQGAGLVQVISAETNTLADSLTLDFATCNFSPRPLTQFAPCTEDGPSSPVFDSANGDIYVSNGGGDTVSVISGATGSLVTNVGVGGGPITPTIDSANGDIYVANSESTSVSVISSAKNAVVANLTVGNQPFQAVLNPMNGDIYVPSLTQDSCGAGVCIINSTLSIISGATNTVVATVPLCKDPGGAFASSNGSVYVSCGDGTVWVISPTTAQSSATSTQQLGEILPDCGTPFNTLLNPAPKGTVYLKVVTDNGGTVITNGTLFLIQGGSFGWMTYCISMSDVNGTGYIQLAPVNFNGTHGGDFITSGYYNVTLWVGSYNPNVTNNPPPSYWATIPSIQVQPNSTTYVTVSVPSGVVTMVTSNDGSGAVTTTTTSATTIKQNGG